MIELLQREENVLSKQRILTRVSPTKPDNLIKYELACGRMVLTSTTENKTFADKSARTKPEEAAR